MLLVPIVVYIIAAASTATAMWRLLEDDTHRAVATFFVSIPLTVVLMLLVRRWTNPAPTADERARDAWTQDAPQSGDLSSWRVLQGDAPRSAPPTAED